MQTSTSFRVVTEGYDPNDNHEVSLEAVARPGDKIEILMRPEEGGVLALALSHGDFLHFLRLADALLRVAVEAEDGND